MLKSRAATLAVACVLIAGGTVGGTVAWITQRSAPLKNTFSSSLIGVEISETPTDDGDEDPHTNLYTMTPGAVIAKDPEVTVQPGSVDAWLFVKLDKSENFDRFLSYAVEDGWTALEGTQDVYWRTAQQSDTAQNFGVLKDDAVTVRPDVTAAMLNTLTESTRPALAVTAYAVQMQSVDTAAQAWALVENQSMTP